MFLVGLVSTYAEGALGEAAVRSLEDVCHRILIAEGPIGKRTEPNHQWDGPDVIYGTWKTDAEKRTDLLNRARSIKHVPPESVWAVVVDGDEQLLNAHNLPLWIRRAEYGDSDLLVTGGFPLRIVEMDGTTVQAFNRVYRVHQVDAYVHSGAELRLRDSATSIPSGNVPNWQPGDQITGYNRPPLQGEPHILHLSELRDPARRAKRQSVAELEDYAERAKKAGIELPTWAEA